MSRYRYFIRPMEHGLSSEAPALNLPYEISPSVENVRIDQRSVQNRPGYHTADRDLGAGKVVYGIILYQIADGTRVTLYLTGTDLLKRETATGGTWSYKTETYTTGTISSITGTAVVGSGTSWDGNVAAGDYFIMDDDHDADTELDSNWTAIAGVTDDTHLTLASSYTKNGSGYKIRKVYTMPTNERWQWAIVDDKFCFTNGNTDVQYYSGSNYASALDTTYASKARYCIEYANRLVLADSYVSSLRNPYRVTWSGEDDPTSFDPGADSSAGSADMMRTEDYITGLGRVGQEIVVYKRDSLIFGNETGVSTAPIEFPIIREGVGCIAPYSIVHVRGTNLFLGRDDFYQIDRNEAIPVGGSNISRIKHRFFDIVSDTEAYNTWGYTNHNENSVFWFANTAEGHKAFVWNYVTAEWAEHTYYHEISAGGKGAV
uniref:Uncharacterized protein n=1 Tax=viral metagenome TaxID=1070528 RepID=A0A6M3ISL5_9ZZZZ